MEGGQATEPVPTGLLELLRTPGILSRLLGYMAWTEFSALANANHVLKALFEEGDVDVFGTTLPIRAAPRRSNKLKQVIFARFIPGYQRFSVDLADDVEAREEEDDAERVVTLFDVDLFRESKRFSALDSYC